MLYCIISSDGGRAYAASLFKRSIAHHSMDQNSHKGTDWLDGAAVTLSTLCLIHCAALPLLIVGLPSFAQFSASHLHAQALMLVIPLSFLALGLGFRRHRDVKIVAVGIVGMLLLVFGATIAHQQLGLAADRAFTIGGSLTLATAHFLNSYRKKLINSSL